MTARPKLIPHEPRCQHRDCRRLAAASVRMWRRTYGPFCQTHADECAESMAAFEERLDARTAPLTDGAPR